MDVMKSSALLLFMVLSAVMSVCSAGSDDGRLVVGDGATRVIFPLDEQKISLELSNSQKTDFLVVQTVLAEDHETRHKGFMLTPEVRELRSGENAQMVIRRVKNDFPQDRETLCYLVTKLMPKRTSEAAIQSGFDTMISVRQKLLVRPASLKVEESTRGAATTFSVKRSENGIRLLNRSPYYRILYGIELDGVHRELTDDEINIAPFSELEIRSDKTIKTLSWALIDDRGYASKWTESAIED